MIISPTEFDQLLKNIVVNKDDIPPRVALAVSGGGDSMAMLMLMMEWARGLRVPIEIHVLTVDHGLRSESKIEAKQVAAWVKELSKMQEGPGSSSLLQRGDVRDDKVILKHKVLTWVGVKPKTKIAETARAKRYELMADYCRAHQISHLFLAHTLDDQSETVLMRLASGSGVDGLAGMGEVSVYDTLFLCRPLLSISHDRLIDTLRAAGQGWIEDPSNKNQKSARVRVRTARDVLAAEGLTPGRMGKLATRASCARDVLNAVADRAWMNDVQVDDIAHTVTILCHDFDGWFTDTQIRVMTRAMNTASQGSPRLEQIEDLVESLGGVANDKTIRRTLAGGIITRGAKWIKIRREGGRRPSDFFLK